MTDEQPEAMFERIVKARAAILAKIGPWQRGTPGESGKVGCPACGEPDALSYSRSGYNGHIAAGCLTDGCVRWME